MWMLSQSKTIQPAIIKFLTMAEVKGYFDSNGPLKIELLRQGCKMLNIPFVGGGIFFCKKPEDPSKELDSLASEMSKQLHPGFEYLVAYEKLNRAHPALLYYKVIALRSNDMLDFKKAFKVHKLKAFL